MAVELGINPITWTNDDVPELGGDTPLETCLAETRVAGYSGTELGGKFPAHSGRAAADPGRHGLELVSGWYDGRILEREVAEECAAILPHLTLLRDLGCQDVVYADTSGGARRAFRRSRSARARRRRLAGLWPQAHRARRAHGRVRRPHGVPPPHGHDRRDRRRGRPADGHTGEAVGLLYDTGHCLFAGGDPAALLERHVARVVHVHCKDVRRAVLDRARRTT